MAARISGWRSMLWVPLVGWALGSATLGCSNTRPTKSEEKTPASAAATAPPPPTAASLAAPPAPKTAAAPASSEPPFPATKKRYVVAALGDSITDARVGGGEYLRWLRQRCPKSQFLDFGRGGDMVNQMRRRFDNEISPSARSTQLTTLLVYGGVNDLYSDLTAGRTNDRIESDLSALYQGAKQLHLQVVAVTVSPWGGFRRYFNARRSDNTRLLNSWILGQVASGAVDRAVDSYPLLSCGDPEKLCASYESAGHDGLHPGPQGHAILGQALLERAFADCE